MKKPIYLTTVVFCFIAINNTFGMYNSKMGRWLTKDPLGVVPNDKDRNNLFKVLKQYLDGLNLYGYCKNNGVRYSDSYGNKIRSCPESGKDCVYGKDCGTLV